VACGWILALKINKKYSGFLTVFIMVIALDSTMSFVMTSVNVGWTEMFLQNFVNGWLIGFVVALPTSIIVLPLANRLVNKIVSD
jgi:hypothetical protein